MSTVRTKESRNSSGVDESYYDNNQKGMWSKQKDNSVVLVQIAQDLRNNDEKFNRLSKDEPHEIVCGHDLV